VIGFRLRIGLFLAEEDLSTLVFYQHQPKIIGRIANRRGFALLARFRVYYRIFGIVFVCSYSLAFDLPEWDFQSRVPHYRELRRGFHSGRTGGTTRMDEQSQIAVCAICKRPITTEQERNTDERGLPIHTECYRRRVAKGDAR
jgi:hypothetical protein